MASTMSYLKGGELIASNMFGMEFPASLCVYLRFRDLSIIGNKHVNVINIELKTIFEVETCFLLTF